MRTFARFFGVRVRTALRSASVVFLLLAALLSLAPLAMSEPEAEDTLALAIVNEDKGPLGAQIVQELLQSEDMRVYAVTRAQALRLLALGRAEAAAIIKPEYSEKIANEEFRNTVELYVSSAARETAAASEPVLNHTMLCFMEETAVARTRAFLQEQGLSLTPEQEAKLREEARKVRESGALATVVAHIPPDDAGVASSSTEYALRCYAAFSVFYILVSAGWVADVSGSHLTLRIRQMGVKRAALLLSAGLAHVVLCFLAGAIVLPLGAWIGGGQVLESLRLLPALALYILAVLGLALFIAALARSATALFLITPAVTFLNAALSGLLFPLPDWAAVLTAASRALPGRQLALFLTTGNAGGLALCGALYLLVGLLFAALLAEGGRGTEGGRL